jgi:hypothetical protein
MRIRYYVVAKGQQYEVFREDISKGASVMRSRAADLAKTLARLETRFTRTPTEVLVETADGRMRTEMRYDPEAAAYGHVVQIGAEQVLVR